jgi:eukaryotic-like serine/threonine-protein kinase
VAPFTEALFSLRRGKPATMTVETDLFPPRYRGPKLVGHGGMGDIYRATDDTLGRAVAIKLLAERYANDEAVRGRFTREALAAARLSGEPNTVTIFDVGEWNDRPFIVMEYLSGDSLERKLRDEGAQPAARALRWLDQAARALDAAHARGVVHRDVKPGNLLLDGDGNVHVADFGIATAAGLDSLTQTGTIIGTAGYLSPEQAQGARATPASDVYALGVVAFELLTGERPFQSESTTAEAAAHVHAPIPAISERNSELPRELDAIFEMALAKVPDERYESCSALVSELAWAIERTTGSISVAAPPPPGTTVPLRRDGAPPPGRRGLPILPIVVALLLLLGATGAVLAALLPGDGDDGGRATTFVTTVREQGTTVRETVTTTTETPPPPPPPAATQPPPSPPQQAPSGSSGAALNDAGFRKMQAGDYAGALPLLEQAVQKLQGASTDVEAFALYNLAFTRFQLGRCDGVLEMLDRSEAIQGQRDEIDALRAQAQERCG